MNSYFDANQELRRLSRRAEQLLALQRQYERVAPPSLTRASRVLSLEQQTLMLSADNGAVAAKLRQLAPELAGLLQNAGCEVTRIQVRVQVALPPAQPAPVAILPGAAARQQLVDLARKLPDSPLKSALQRLAASKP
ncbi:MAG: DUF721 domain-containing protein [Nitrosomonadales bacterium]|nr:DUF721 domain-containing protein [Nitrosomonadales bacterium]